MRRHLTYANVVATLALVFAMSGGALAAKHYLLTSTKQIKPSLLATLKGKAGPRGPAGPAGPIGVGVAGLTGQRGDAGATGPSGSTAGTAVVQNGGATILTDAATGVQVSQSASFHAFVFKNLNATDKTVVYGVVEAGGKAVLPWEAVIEPGETATSPSNAASTNFLDVTVIRTGDTVATSPLVHLTCGGENANIAAANCLAAH